MTLLEKRAVETKENGKIDRGRYFLDLGSNCFIHSRSKNKWFRGNITEKFIDYKTNKEWIVVKYNGNKKKKIQRLCTDLRPYTFQGIWQIYLIYGMMRIEKIENIYLDLIQLILKFYGFNPNETWNIETSHPSLKIKIYEGIITCPYVRSYSRQTGFRKAAPDPYLHAFGTNIVSKGEIAKWKLNLDIYMNTYTGNKIGAVVGIIDVAKISSKMHCGTAPFCHNGYKAGIGYSCDDGYIYDGIKGVTKYYVGFMII